MNVFLIVVGCRGASYLLIVFLPLLVLPLSLLALFAVILLICALVGGPTTALSTFFSFLGLAYGCSTIVWQLIWGLLVDWRICCGNSRVLRVISSRLTAFIGLILQIEFYLTHILFVLISLTILAIGSSFSFGWISLLAGLILLLRNFLKFTIDNIISARCTFLGRIHLTRTSSLGLHGLLGRLASLLEREVRHLWRSKLHQSTVPVIDVCLDDIAPGIAELVV